MIGKPITGRSFGGCVRYLVNKPEASILEAVGVREQSANTITRDFDFQRKMNPELGKAVGHTILSWSKEDADKLTDKMMVEVAKAYMQKMGITDTQYVMVKHTDRQHPHLHLVYNRVDNQGKTISDKNNYRRNVQVCRKLTEAHNFYLAPGKELVNRQRLKGNDKVRYSIHDAIKEALKTVRSWQQLEQKLEQKGIEMKVKFRSGTHEIQGISFAKDGLVFKGSAIDRAFSFAKLNSRLAEVPKQHITWERNSNGYDHSKETNPASQHIPGGEAGKFLDILMGYDYETAAYNPFQEELKRKKKKKGQSKSH